MGLNLCGLVNKFNISFKIKILICQKTMAKNSKKTKTQDIMYQAIKSKSHVIANFRNI